MKFAFTISEMKEIIESTSTVELRDEYRLYCSLQSRGVTDEIIISLIEQEMQTRNIKIDEFNSDFLS